MLEQTAPHEHKYRVRGLKSLHDVRLVVQEFGELLGVDEVDMEIDSGMVTLRGTDLPAEDEINVAVHHLGFTLTS